MKNENQEIRRNKWINKWINDNNGNLDFYEN